MIYKITVHEKKSSHAYSWNLLQQSNQTSDNMKIKW